MKDIRYLLGVERQIRKTYRLLETTWAEELSQGELGKVSSEAEIIVDSVMCSGIYSQSWGDAPETTENRRLEKR